MQQLSQLTQERHDHLSQALGLLKWKTMAGVLYLFDSHAWVETPQFRCHLERDDGAAVTNDEQARDVNRAHHVVMLGVGRRENVEGTHAGLQSRLGLKLDDLGRAMGVSGSGLRNEVRLL